ncbi:hypothetical protein Tco_1530482 [Tanacetum coccineum]
MLTVIYGSLPLLCMEVDMLATPNWMTRGWIDSKANVARHPNTLKKSEVDWKRAGLGRSGHLLPYLKLDYQDKPIPIVDSDSSETSLSFSDNSLPEFESFSDHTEETRNGSTTTHANYSLPEYESFHFDNPSLPRPPPEPPDVCLDMLYNDESFEPG